MEPEGSHIPVPDQPGKAQDGEGETAIVKCCVTCILQRWEQIEKRADFNSLAERGDSTPPLLSNPPETQALRWSNLKCHHIRKVVDVTDFWLVGIGIIHELHPCQSGRS